MVQAMRRGHKRMDRFLTCWEEFCGVSSNLKVGLCFLSVQVLYVPGPIGRDRVEVNEEDW